MFKRVCLVLALVPLVVLAGVIAVALSPSPARGPPVLANPMLYLQMGEKNYCSGVHIGGNFILTAAHCTDAGKIIVHTKQLQGPAQVLWVSKLGDGGYDIALLHAKVSNYVDASPLSCKPLHLGQKVRVDGNPMDLSWISVYGTVAGAQLPLEEWPEVVPLDITGGPGDSGSPVYDEAGSVVGIVVAGYDIKIPLRSFMWVVSSSTICKLLVPKPIGGV